MTLLQASTKEVSLTGCSFPEDISTTDMPLGQAVTHEPMNIAIPGTNNIQPLMTETAKEFTAELNVFQRS